MSEECTHDCSNCGAACSSRDAAPQHDAPNPNSSVKKVIGVVSGKGGVGKSMTSAMLAVSMRRLGFKAGVLDADITGPSIPRLFGVKGPATGDGESLNPVSSRTGVEIMSINLLLDDPEAPVVWRGPVIAGAVKQFWQEVVWDVDFLFVDMPPGTGDVPLTVFQTLPVDGIVIVSSPQELVGMIVGKAVQMAQMMHVPILGLVENMSYAVCPDCGKHINVFGDSHVDEIADKYKLPVLAKMPIDPELAKEADAGMIEMFAGDYLDNAAQTVAKLLKK
jgi:Mrp family chromosome partitioning ATPase